MAATSNLFAERRAMEVGDPAVVRESDPPSDNGWVVHLKCCGVRCAKARDGDIPDWMANGEDVRAMQAEIRESRLALERKMTFESEFKVQQHQKKGGQDRPPRPEMYTPDRYRYWGLELAVAQKDYPSLAADRIEEALSRQASMSPDALTKAGGFNATHLTRMMRRKGPSSV